MALPPSLTMPPPGNDIRSANAPAPAAGDAFPPPLEDIIVPIPLLPMPLFSRDKPSSKRRDAVVDVSPPRKERAFDDDFRVYGAAYSSKNSSSVVPPSSRVPDDRYWYQGDDDMMSSTTTRLRTSMSSKDFSYQSLLRVPVAARQSQKWGEKNDDQ